MKSPFDTCFIAFLLLCLFNEINTRYNSTLNAIKNLKQEIIELKAKPDEKVIKAID